MGTTRDMSVPMFMSSRCNRSALAPRVAASRDSPAGVIVAAAAFPEAFAFFEQRFDRVRAVNNCGLF